MPVYAIVQAGIHRIGVGNAVASQPAWKEARAAIKARKLTGSLRLKTPRALVLIIIKKEGETYI